MGVQEALVALTVDERELQTLCQFRKKDVALLKNGVRLEAHFGVGLDTLVLRTCADRYALAAHFLATAQSINRTRPPHHRSSVSRAYYSMYHAARALSFLHHGRSSVYRAIRLRNIKRQPATYRAA